MMPIYPMPTHHFLSATIIIYRHAAVDISLSRAQTSLCPAAVLAPGRSLMSCGCVLCVLFLSFPQFSPLPSSFPHPTPHQPILNLCSVFLLARHLALLLNLFARRPPLSLRAPESLCPCSRPIHDPLAPSLFRR